MAPVSPNGLITLYGSWARLSAFDIVGCGGTEGIRLQQLAKAAVAVLLIVEVVEVPEDGIYVSESVLHNGWQLLQNCSGGGVRVRRLCLECLKGISR